MPNKGKRGGGFYMASGGGRNTTATGSFGRNPYFGMQPGDVPYDMAVDPSQVVQQPAVDTRNFGQRFFGVPSTADSINAQALTAEAQAKARSNIEMEQAKAKKQYEDEMLAKAIVPLLMQNQNLGAIPSSVGTNYADIGNFLQGSYGPLISRFGGAVAFPQAQADIAQAQAQQVGFENARLADLARQPFISPTARSQAMIDARIAGGLEGFALTPQFESLLRYQQANKMAPPFSVGAMEERYEPATGRKYVGPRVETTETPTYMETEIGGKKQMLPVGQPVKSIKYYPGQTLDEDVVGRIENPDPSYPREVSPKSASEVDESGYISTEADPYEIMRRRKLGVINRGAQFQRPPYR